MASVKNGGVARTDMSNNQDYARSGGNGGTAKTRVKGMTILEPYGKDSGDYSGSAADERGPKLAKDKADISHSLKGATAVQSGD